MRAISFAVLLSALCAPAIAAEPACPAWELQVPLLSQYVIESTGAVINKRPVVQPNLTLSCQTEHGRPYFSLWASFQPTDGWLSARTIGSEVDLTAGWFFNFGDNNAWYADINLAYFDVYPITRNKVREDTVQASGEIGRKFRIAEHHSISPYVRIEAPFPTNRDVSGGAYYYVGSRYTWELDESTKLRQRAWIVYDDEAYDSQPGFVAGWRADLDIAVTPWLTLTPNARIMTPISFFEDDRHTTFIAGMTLTARF